MSRFYAMASMATLAIAHAQPASAQATATDPAPPPIHATREVETFGPDYFARFQPYSAYDLVTLLPGFKLEEGDATVRGYAGASGNVLIDGQRPASKQETLEDVLRKIPVASVDHVELLRPGAAGVDMQGRSILANVVRKKDASTRVRLEAGGAFFYKTDEFAPKLAAEFSHRKGDRLIELAASMSRDIDDEHGFGSRDRAGPTGLPLRSVIYGQPEEERIAEATAAYQDNVLGGNLRLNGLLRQTRFRADITNIMITPTRDEEFGTERARTIDSEIGIRFERAIGARTQIEFLALRRMSNVSALNTEYSLSEDATTGKEEDGSETIVRGVVRRSGSLLSIEAGVEGALNVLDSARNLTDHGVAVPLPAANVRVEERRAEPFVTTNWKFSPTLSLEAGGKIEVSRLSQTGDSSLTKTFFYPKPRALLSWAPGKDTQLRFLAERVVGQLTFSNFLGAASLSTGVITAGNPDLEPDKLWRYEVAFERHFWGNGSIVLTARREDVSDVVDRIPVTGPGGTFDAVGNIGSGYRNEGQLDLILPFDRLHLEGLLLKANLLVRDSNVVDPATGEKRRISGDAPIGGEAHLTYELPQLKSRFGIDVGLPTEEASFKFNEVQIDKVGTRVGIFAEYKPTPQWNIRIYAKNLTNSPTTRIRTTSAALRGTVPVSFVETRVLRSGPYVGFTLQRAFGAH